MNDIEIKKEKRKAYMREYMRKRNLKLRGQPRIKMTEEQKKEKMRIQNKQKYEKNRTKLIEYARQKREEKTGISRKERIKKLYNTLTDEEKEYVVS